MKVKKTKQVDVIVCPNLRGIGLTYVVTVAEWRSKRQRAAAMQAVEELITDAFTRAKPRPFEEAGARQKRAG